MCELCVNRSEILFHYLQILFKLSYTVSGALHVTIVVVRISLPSLLRILAVVGGMTLFPTVVTLLILPIFLSYGALLSNCANDVPSETVAFGAATLLYLSKR